MRCDACYTEILVESFISTETWHRDSKHIRPAPSQVFPQSLLVEYSRSLTDNYPIGAVFRLCVAPKQKLDERQHLYAHYRANYEVVALGKTNECPVA